MFGDAGAWSSLKSRRKNQPEPKNGLLHKTKFQPYPLQPKKNHFEIVPFHVLAVSLGDTYHPKKGVWIAGLRLSLSKGIHWLRSCRLPVLHLLPWMKVKWEEKMKLHATFLHPQSFKKSPWNVIIPKKESCLLAIDFQWLCWNFVFSHDFSVFFVSDSLIEREEKVNKIRRFPKSA